SRCLADIHSRWESIPLCLTFLFVSVWSAVRRSSSLTKQTGQTSCLYIPWSIWARWQAIPWIAGLRGDSDFPGLRHSFDDPAWRCKELSTARTWLWTTVLLPIWLEERTTRLRIMAKGIVC